MITTHYYYDSTINKKFFESDFQEICCDLAKKHGAFLRIVKSGAGIVILPDTDRAHDCGPNELAKALHLREEIEKSSTEKTYRDLIIRKEDDNENFFVKLTEEQYRLLTWLYEEELLGAYVEYEKATPFQTI
jgi:hypothetical protein